MTAPRLPFVLGLALVVGLSTFLRVSIALRPSLPVYAWSTHQLRSVLTSWGTCNFGPSSCTPRFLPMPDGMFRGIACNASQGGFCTPMTYDYWTDENCNRTTACGLYHPHRGDQQYQVVAAPIANGASL